MPGTITSDQTTIEDAEVVADYLVLGTFASAQALNNDIKVQGTNAINGRVSANSAWSLATTGAALDLTVSGRHVWIWLRLLTWPSADTQANGGLGISISSDVTPTLTGVSPSDGPTNSKTWYLGGSDTDITTGWVCYCVDPTGTPDLTLGTPVMSSVDRVGLRCKVTGTISNNTRNVQHDIIRYGTGLTVKDGTSGSPAAFADIATADALNANAWGVVTQQSGVYFINGKLSFGTAAQTALTYFKDADRVLVYPAFPVATTFYEMKLAGAASFITTFELGTLSGSLTEGGCIVRGATGAIWTLTANAANTVLHLYGCALSQMRRGLLNSSSDVLNTSFTGCGDLDANGADITGCTFQDLATASPISATYAITVTVASILTGNTYIDCAPAVLWNVNADTNSRLDNSSFISGGTGHGIELGANCPTSISLVDVLFTGYGGTPGSNPTSSSGSANAGVYNNSGKTITINVSGGTTPAIRNGAGATTVVVAAITITFTGLVAGTEIRVFETTGGAEVAGTESTAGTTFAASLQASTNYFVVALAVGYLYVRVTGLTFTSTQDFPINLRVDPNFSN